MLINGAVKSNLRSLGYFGLTSEDLPRVGIYDGGSDMKWLLPQGPVSSERVRSFCHAFLKGELKVVWNVYININILYARYTFVCYCEDFVREWTNQ